MLFTKCVPSLLICLDEKLSYKILHVVSDLYLHISLKWTCLHFKHFKQSQQMNVIFRSVSNDRRDVYKLITIYNLALWQGVCILRYSLVLAGKNLRLQCRKGGDLLTPSKVHLSNVDISTVYLSIFNITLHKIKLNNFAINMKCNIIIIKFNLT